MTAKTPDHIEDRVVELRNEWLSIRKIQDRIQDELDVNIWHWTVHRILERCKDDIQEWAMKDVKILDENVGDAKEESLFGVIEVKDNTYNYTYHEKTDMYIWKVNGEMIMMARDKVLDIFQDYSRISKIRWYSAKNKSQSDIILEYDLSSNEWSFLQNNLFLRTTGANADPVTIMKHDRDGTLEVFAEEQAKHQLKNKYQMHVHEKQQRIFEKDARHAIWVITSFKEKKNFVYEDGGYDFEFNTDKELAEFKKWDVWFYVISDLHGGGWDLEEMQELLRNIAQDIIESWYKKVILNINGDTFESAILWWYHRWQIEEMAQSQWKDAPIFWHWLIRYMASCLENMLIRPIHDAWIELMVQCRAGNHGRWTIKSKDDPYGMHELDMFFAIQQWLKDTNVMFEYAEKLQEVYYLENFLWFDKVAIAMSHGHIPNHKQKRKSIASKYLHKADYVFVIQSHYHNGRLTQESQLKEKDMTETWDRCMLIVTPALCPPNSYALEQVVSDSPRGFVKLENNRYNRFRVLFEYIE